MCDHCVIVNEDVYIFLIIVFRTSFDLKKNCEYSLCIVYCNDGNKSRFILVREIICVQHKNIKTKTKTKQKQQTQITTNNEKIKRVTLFEQIEIRCETTA